MSVAGEETEESEACNQNVLHAPVFSSKSPSSASFCESLGDDTFQFRDRPEEMLDLSGWQRHRSVHALFLGNLATEIKCGLIDRRDLFLTLSILSASHAVLNEVSV